MDILFLDILSTSLDTTLYDKMVIKIDMSLHAQIMNLSELNIVGIDDISPENFLSIFEYTKELKQRLNTISNSINNKSSYSYIVKNALKYIDKHFKEEIFVDDIAKNLHVSQQYFSRIFNKEVGCGVPKYINERKLNHAKYLMRVTDMELTEISDEVSIYPYRRFSSMFKEMYGITPSNYQKINKL